MSNSQQRKLYLRIRDLARYMRKNPTSAEEEFWKRARNRKFFGLKFNRQYIIQCPVDASFTKYYIADFHCHAYKLIVELDGPLHAQQTELDLERTERMSDYGFRVLRFSNQDVLSRWEHVENTIKEFIRLHNTRNTRKSDYV